MQGDDGADMLVLVDSEAALAEFVPNYDAMKEIDGRLSGI